MRYD